MKDMSFPFTDNSGVSEFGLRVFVLNVWGLPRVHGSKDKELRMSEIGDFVHQGYSE